MKLVGVDRHDLAVLDLDHDLRKIDLAVLAEPDARIEALEIDSGDRVAHLLRVERAGRLDRLDEGLDIGDAEAA